MAIKATLLASYLKNIKRNLRRLLYNTRSHNIVKDCKLEPFVIHLTELIKEFESFEKEIKKRPISSIDVKSEVVGTVRHFVKQYQRIVDDINIIYRDRCTLTETVKREDFI